MDSKQLIKKNIEGNIKREVKEKEEKIIYGEGKKFKQKVEISVISQGIFQFRFEREKMDYRGKLRGIR